MHVIVHLTTPVVPKKNSKIPRVSRYGKPYLQSNPRAVTSETALHLEAQQEFRRSAWPMVPEGKIAMTLTFPHHSHADVIGLAETILDALQGVAYENDRQVKVLAMAMLDKPTKDKGPEWSCHIDISTV